MIKTRVFYTLFIKTYFESVNAHFIRYLRFVFIFKTDLLLNELHDRVYLLLGKIVLLCGNLFWVTFWTDWRVNKDVELHKIFCKGDLKELCKINIYCKSPLRLTAEKWIKLHLSTNWLAVNRNYNQSFPKAPKVVALEKITTNNREV